MRVLHRFATVYTNPTPILCLSFSHSLPRFHFLFTVQSEVHEPAQHLSGAAQRCHHIGAGRGSGQHSATGHGPTAEADSVATVAFGGCATAIAKVSVS